MFPEFKTYYQNFALDNATVSLTVIIWAICIGLAVGVIAYTFSRHSANRIVKALARGEYNTKESCATLEDLQLKDTRLLRKLLRDYQPLRKYIVIANPEECKIERKKNFFDAVYRFFRGEDMAARYDLSKARLYMTDESRIVAEVRYTTKGNPFVIAVIYAVLFLICGLGITFCMPKLLELVDTMITAYKNL